MDTIYISATKLKTETASLLEMVSMKKKRIVILRHKRAIAELVPSCAEEGATDFFGAIPDFESPESLRKGRYDRKRETLSS